MLIFSETDVGQDNKNDHNLVHSLLTRHAPLSIAAGTRRIRRLGTRLTQPQKQAGMFNNSITFLFDYT